jgi:hypothetical protein
MRIFVRVGLVVIAASLVARAARADEGGWIEAAKYGLRVDDVKSCGVGARPTTAGRVWVGVSTRLKTKEGALFVSARDFSLERGGVIIGARHVDAPVLPRCLPVLAATSLRAQQSVGGFVLFEIPTAWTTERTSLVLAYRPTRWGGAQRIEARISSCFDTCADTPRTSRRKEPHSAIRR